MTTFISWVIALMIVSMVAAFLHWLSHTTLEQQERNTGTIYLLELIIYFLIVAGVMNILRLCGFGGG